MPRPTTPTARTGRTHARVRVADRGSVSVELAIVFPVLLAVITAVVQYGLWFHARSLAVAAAQEGVSVARTYTATPGTGADRALTFIADHGGDTLLEPVAVATLSGPGHVSVTVSGTTLSLLPGVTGPPVTATASAPVERLTSPGTP